MATPIERLNKIKEQNEKLEKERDELISDGKVIQSKINDALKELGLESVDQLGKTKEEAEKELDELLTDAENLLGISNY